MTSRRQPSSPSFRPAALLLMQIVAFIFVIGVACTDRVVAEPQAAESPSRNPAHLPVVQPEEVGFNAERLQYLEPIVQEGLDEKKMPGCVIAFGRGGKLAWLKAYGHRQLEPSRIPMTTDTVFDMASITKPVATATSVMILVERGQVRLRNRFSSYFPDFAANGKKEITVTQLLTHHGGLIPDNAVGDYDHGREEAWRRILNLETYVEPGSKFVYTDVGFIALAELVREQTGQNIHEFSQANLFQPLGMTETGYLPAEPLRERAATTQEREGRWMRGEVHDPRAYRLGGVAGHAGLFSTAEDLAIYAEMMLRGGEYRGKRILSPAMVKQMTSAYDVSGNVRGLGWDKQSVYSSNRGETFSASAFGHGGFTGTVLWIDPELDLFFIFLSNRVHPDGKGSVNSLAGRIATVIAGAIETPSAPRSGDLEDHSAAVESEVSTGLDQLVATDFEPLAGQRIGLIANHTSIDAAGRHAVELMHASEAVNLTALFSPEHGFAGKLDVSNIEDSSDDTTGLKVFSLYGKSRKPTAMQLEEVDTLVFDIQDIGARFYTYISTMGMALEAAAEHGKRFVVLDRPNPINGVDVDGPVLDEGKESFVGYHALPVRHGMTVGELARMFVKERKLEVQLEVIQVEGWKRKQFLDATGLRWVNPSPNMRNLNQALLYPGIGLLETTNLSVGRGTDTPFEVIGAPWIEARLLARKLNESGLSGVRFVPYEFSPSSSVHEGAACGGVQILITDRSRVSPLDVGFEIATTLRQLYPDDWKHERYGRLLGDEQVLKGVASGWSREEIRALYIGELQEFQQRRTEFLLY